MSSYNLRRTSLNDSKLDAELVKRGAKTFGSTQRKQERLQRFLDLEAKEEQARETLRIIIANEQEKVQTRSRSRIIEIISAFLA